MHDLLNEIKQHKVIVFIAVGLILLVFVIAQRANASGGNTTTSAPTYVGAGNPQATDTSNAGTSLAGTDTNTSAIQALSDTNDINYKYASEIAALTNTSNQQAAQLQLQTAAGAASISQSNLAFTTQQAITQATATENLRETGAAFDTTNVLKGGLNAVTVQGASDAEQLDAQKNSYNFLYGGGGSGTNTDPNTGNTPAAVMFRFSQAPLVSQQQRDLQTAAANTQNTISLNNATASNNLTASVQNTQNSILINNDTNANTIALNAATTANQMQVAKQQNDFQDHINNVNARNNQTSGILGIAGKILGGLF